MNYFCLMCIIEVLIDYDKIMMTEQYPKKKRFALIKDNTVAVLVYHCWISIVQIKYGLFSAINVEIMTRPKSNKTWAEQYQCWHSLQ